MSSLSGLIRRSAILLMAGLLMLFSLLIYIGGDALLRRYVDDRLLGLATTLARIIEQRPDVIEGNGALVPSAEEARSRQEHEALLGVSHTVLVLSEDGRILWQGADAVPRPAASSRSLDQVRRGRTVLETVALPDQAPVRRVLVPISQHGSVRYVLQAEESLAFTQDALRGLAFLLAAGSVVMMLGAWARSSWLARKILAPIGLLSRTAESMSEADLGERLNLDSPYEEFRRLTQAFNTMMDRFQRACESQRRFVDHAAHEMQTPLSVLQGSLEVTLHKARTPEEYREALISNLEQVERLSTLTRSLLTLSQFAGDRPPVRLVALDVHSLVRELIDELAVLAEDRRITLTLEAGPVPPVLGDRQWLKQAVINLLDNALRYTPAGGRVTVRLHQDADQAVIAVEDTGHGIEPVHLPHLFERFYRTDRARARDSGGTGLGLPIVRGIVEAHGGTVSVESRVGKGSTFTLRIPIPRDPAVGM